MIGVSVFSNKKSEYAEKVVGIATTPKREFLRKPDLKNVVENVKNLTESEYSSVRNFIDKLADTGSMSNDSGVKNAMFNGEKINKGGTGGAESEKKGSSFFSKKTFASVTKISSEVKESLSSDFHNSKRKIGKFLEEGAQSTYDYAPSSNGRDIVRGKNARKSDSVDYMTSNSVDKLIQQMSNS